jgi:hypothetical protein
MARRQHDSPNPEPKDGFKILLDAHTALDWLKELAKAHSLPPVVMQFLSVLSMLTNKRVELSLKVIDRDGPR